MDQTALATWTCTRIAANLEPYLTDAHSDEAMVAIRDHLDTCPGCWQMWNRFRWERAKGSPLYRELKAFEGSRFRPCFDSSRALAAEWDKAAPATESEVRAFYAQTSSYLYNLAIWEASGHRPAYVSAALPLLQRANCRAVIDYGSGIGSDIIALRCAGLTVRGCELPSPHANFARWRLRIRDQDDSLIDPDAVDDLLAEAPDTLDHRHNRPPARHRCPPRPATTPGPGPRH